MIAYKFLRDGRVGPFSRVRWPEPSAREPWVKRSARAGVRAQHVHACRVDDLPEWLDDELWRVELKGDVAVDCGTLVAARGRLLARIDAWDPDAAAEFADACAARAHDATRAGADPGYAEDAAAHAAGARADPAAAAGHAAAAAFIAAHAAAYAAGDPAAVARERTWQAQWLSARLGLAG